MNNVPKGGRGVSSGKLMTIYDHAAAQSLLVSGEGKQNGQVGEAVTLTPATPSVVWAPGRRRLLPQEAVGSSGLGNLLAPGRAGREPCCCALLCAEAVLILQEEGRRGTVRPEGGYVTMHECVCVHVRVCARLRRGRGRSLHSLCLCGVRLWHWQCAHLVPLASSHEHLVLKG